MKTPAARAAAGVFLLLALTYGQFFQASTWGAACRFDLARALVEQGSLTIDDYEANTGDKAIWNGHVWSDKAPLPSFLAAPGVAIAWGVRAMAGGRGGADVWLAIAGGLAAFFASGLVTAAGGAVFLLALHDRGIPLGIAVLTTLFLFFGTTLFPYATVLQGHAPAAAWLFLFFHLAFPARGPLSPRRAAWAGFAASAAVATEYLTGPPLVALAAIALLRDRRTTLRLGAAMAAGAAPGAILLGAYHNAAFGSPFEVGYKHVALPFFQRKMEAGLFGITAPDPVVAMKLLFGPFRGLLFACPVVIAAIAGVVLLWRHRDRDRRLDAAAITIVFVFYWMLNAGYSTWSGGWAIGPRHLVPTIPFLGLGLAAALARWPRATSGLAAVSILFMLAATAVQPEVPEDIGNPIFGHLLPHFVRGELSVGEQGFADLYPARADPAVPDRWDAFLLGEAMRLPGLLALLPVLSVWGIGFARLRRIASGSLKNGYRR